MFASLLLCRSTLRELKGVLQDLNDGVRIEVEKKIKNMMTKNVGYEAKYADWLAKNVHRLKENSIKILEQDGRDSGASVWYSTVVDFNYETELKKFKAYATSGTFRNQSEKRDFLEKAIELTSDAKIQIELNTMKQVITKVLNLSKLDAETKSNLQDQTLNKWPDLL